MPFATQDLRDTLNAWHYLIAAINLKSPKPAKNAFASKGLYSRKTMLAEGLRKDGFAWKFFSNAHKPVFDLLGPGLRLARDDELINNSFKPSGDEVDTWDDGITNFPIPVLIGNDSVDSWVRGNSKQVSWGLYLERSGWSLDFAVEDSSLLALPYPIGEHGLAMTADGIPLNESRVAPAHLQLYLIGNHPLVPCHNTQLYMVLITFVHHVWEGLWAVGANGIEEPNTVFLNADTEEGRYEYMIYP